MFRDSECLSRITIANCTDHALNSIKDVAHTFVNSDNAKFTTFMMSMTGFNFSSPTTSIADRIPMIAKTDTRRRATKSILKSFM